MMFQLECGLWDVILLVDLLCLFPIVFVFPSVPLKGPSAARKCVVRPNNNNNKNSKINRSN